ncbi:glycosyltransferase [Paracoccus sp. (in: a-proteobacteria)]|uniref:glycosyltransferase n=1 Tax=Paracoccus sp. TaxID=267 RepID=UPI0026DED19F|nr:glycosyltransferase [Paracoccus sp. (in: a-proteobacteria)]MDO5370373.1 glycosyltransferase [Paracoccus sp. (in: a-proteobacteria)]
MPLVLVRTPTYRRPDLLGRALRCLQAQTHGEWICEVRDDCPDGSARNVVEDFGDPRIRYVQNRPQKFMVRNLDDCFLRENPYGADCFFMLEDDNQVRPEFMARGLEIIGQAGVTICQMNQVIEHDSRTGNARIGDKGIFDGIYDERVHAPEELHLAMFGAVGLSNGAVFWSRHIRGELALRVDTIPTLEEYLRTRLVSEPIYISREKLAVWAENEQSTSRNAGLGKGWLRRELDLKASVTALQRAVWKGTPERLRKAFLEGDVLRLPMDSRREALRKAGIRAPGVPSDPGLKAKVKRLAVRHVGREHPSVAAIAARVAN